nr:hypothetical protein [Tanacetum cinerariifolium]
ESSSAAAARPARGFRADYGFVATVDREIMHDPEREVGYGITDSWDEIVETLQGAPVSIDTELGGYIPFPPLPTILSPPSPILAPAPPPSPIRSLGYRAAMIRLRDEAASTSPPPSQLPSASRREDRPETERQLLAGRLNMLFRDRRAHAYTCLLMEAEARMSIEAWTRATDASDLVHGEVISLRTTVLGQISEIRELQAANRRRQTVISELLRLEHRRSTETSESRTALQGQITALQGQVTALQAQVATLHGQHGLARDSTHPEPPEEAGGSA